MPKPRRIVVTGAAGNLGGKAVEALQCLEHVEVVGIDRNEAKGTGFVQADLNRYDPAWTDCFDGADGVLHMAADAGPFAPWEPAQRTNIDLTLNVFHAAAKGGVRRFVFGSSNVVLAGYRFRRERLTPELPPRPITPYGAAKLLLERYGLAQADRTGMAFLALRIGCCPQENILPGPHFAFGRWGQEMWLGDDDWAQAVARALDHPFEGAAVVNIVSRNEGMRWDLTSAFRAIGYDPVQRSSPILTPSVRLKNFAARLRDRLFPQGAEGPPFGMWW